MRKRLILCLFLASSAAAQTQIGGGGGGVAANSPIPANQAQGPQYNVVNYSSVTINDAKKSFTAVTANGNAHVTNATDAPWLSTDVGKKMYCLGFSNNSALTTTIATITAFNSTSDVTVNTTGNGNAQNPSTCIWFSNKATTAMLAAGTAAKQTLSISTSNQGLVQQYAGSVFCPPGGYVVDAPFFSQVSASGHDQGVSFIGAGKHNCVIYVSPDAVVTNNSWILNSQSTQGAIFSDFTVDCSGVPLFLAAPGFRFQAFQGFTVARIAVLGCGSQSDAQGLFAFSNVQNGIIDEVLVNNTSTVTGEPPFVITGGNGIHIRNWSTTNPQGSGSGPGSAITQSGGQAFAGGPRSNAGISVFIDNSVFDEGASGSPLLIQNGSSVSITASGFFSGTTNDLNIDGTSSAYISNSNFIPFGGACGGGNRQGIVIASGGAVYSTGNEIQGCGANGAGLSAAVSGPVGATYVDLGGNTIRNCPGGPPCPLVTAANYATLGFNGGIIPKATVTHTPNTCVDTLGTVATTVLCNSLLDQNYQILNITASSNAVTTCATPPIVTISDGAQTATLTLTSGASTWSSGALSAANAKVFASGNTMTITYDLNGLAACAVPPTNLAISYVLQSVLNP
jgi:hypothetical protein